MAEIKLSDHFTYKKLIKFVIPSIAMMVFTSVYYVVDGFFVSNFAGKSAFAAIIIILPFVMILGSVGFMVGTGGTALISKALGEGDKKRANRYFTMMIYVTVICGIISSVIGIVFLRPAAYKLGATPDMIEDCVLYGKILLIFNTPYMLQCVFQTFFAAAEKPKLGLWYTVGAGLTNMVLDAVLVGLLGKGIFGAAMATGISQCVGGILPIFYFMRKNDSLLKITKTKFEKKVLFKAFSNGLSEFVGNISMSVVSIFYNIQLMNVAGENGVAAYGVFMYVGFIFAAINIGYSIGSAPIVGYNYGAENHSELKNVFKKSKTILWITGLGLTVLSEILAVPLSYIFVGYDKVLFDMTVYAFRIISFSFLLNGINIFASAFFTALNNGLVSALISFMRTFAFQVIFVLILPILWGIDGIWFALVAAEGAAFILSEYFLRKKKKVYHY